MQARRLAGVLETTLYHDGGGREAVKSFYGGLLGLPAVAGWEDGVDEYERWRERLTAAGVEIVQDSAWGGGGRSFYFKDPAGNLLEIADCDFWPQPA